MFIHQQSNFIISTKNNASILIWTTVNYNSWKTSIIKTKQIYFEYLVVFIFWESLNLWVMKILHHKFLILKSLLLRKKETLPYANEEKKETSFFEEEKIKMYYELKVKKFKKQFWVALNLTSLFFTMLCRVK